MLCMVMLIFGINGDGFSVLLSRAEGGIVSLAYNGKEYITRTPKTTFWESDD